MRSLWKHRSLCPGSTRRMLQRSATAVRAAVLGYAPTQATVDGLRNEIEELRKAPDAAELLQLRRDKAELEQLRPRINDLATRANALEGRLREAEQRQGSPSSSARIAALESEIANLRKQLNVGASVEQDDLDPSAVRASLLELD